MKLLLAILISMLAMVDTSWAAMAKIGSQTKCDAALDFSSGAATFTYPANLTNGSLAVMSVSAENRTVSSIAGAGSSYSINGSNTNSAGLSRNISLWKAVTSGTDASATVTLSGATGAAVYVCFVEFSGNDADQSGSVANGSDTEGGTSSFSSGSVTPPTANNVVVAASDRTPTGAPGWSEDGAFTMVSTADQNYSFGYLIQASATAQSFDMTSVDNEYAIMRIGAFAGTSSGGGGSAANPFRLRLNQ